MGDCRAAGTLGRLVVRYRCRYAIALLYLLGDKHTYVFMFQSRCVKEAYLGYITWYVRGRKGKREKRRDKKRSCAYR